MSIREDIVREARDWLGTPFHHQGRVKRAGVDCAGVVVGVARQLRLSDFDTSDYGRRPNSLELQRIAVAQMFPIAVERALPGDVYLVEINGQAQHLAFATPIGMLHAYAPARCVVEHLIDDDWRARLISAFVLPGVARKKEDES